MRHIRAFAGSAASEVVRSFSKCWLHADALAKTILNRNGSLGSVFRHRGDQRAEGGGRTGSSPSKRRAVRGDARAVAAVAAAARQLPRPRTGPLQRARPSARFDRLGSVEARLKRLVEGRPVVQVEDDVAVVASFDFAHTAGSVLDSDRWCPAPGSRSIGRDATYKRPGCADYLIIRARKDHQIQTGPPRIIARAFGDARSMSWPSMPMGGRGRRAGWHHSSRRAGLYAVGRGVRTTCYWMWSFRRRIAWLTTRRESRRRGARPLARPLALLARDLQGAQG